MTLTLALALTLVLILTHESDCSGIGDIDAITLGVRSRQSYATSGGSDDAGLEGGSDGTGPVRCRFVVNVALTTTGRVITLSSFGVLINR